MTGSVGGRLIAFGRRSREVIVLSAVTGAVVGLLVAVFEWITAAPKRCRWSSADEVKSTSGASVSCRLVRISCMAASTVAPSRTSVAKRFPPTT
jgi:hypothetical protein